MLGLASSEQPRSASREGEVIDPVFQPSFLLVKDLLLSEEILFLFECCLRDLMLDLKPWKGVLLRGRRRSVFKGSLGC